MFDAINTFNGGLWQELDTDRRLVIARDKAYAELAHFIYSHDYAKLEGLDLKKYNDAREAIVEHLKGGEDEDSPFKQALKDIAAKMKEPPQSVAARTHPIAKTTQ